MFCPKCQTQNPDGVGFCGRCGTPLTAPAAPVQPTYAQPAPVNPVVAAVKAVCASPLTLIAAIAVTVSFLLGFINVITLSYEESVALIYGFAVILDTLGLGDAGIVTMLRDVLDMIVPIYLIISIPTIFVLIGLWVTYTGALNRQSPTARTGGLGLIKAGMIIQMIGACIFIGFAIIATIGGGIALSDTYYSQEAAPALIGMGVIFMLVLAFMIVYYVLVLKSLKSAKMALKTGQVTKKASAFVGVFCFITAFVDALSLLTSLSSGDAMSMLSAVCSVAGVVCFGILIFNYRSKTAPFVVAYAQPAYAQPVYQQPVYQPPYQQPVYQQPTYPQPTYAQPTQPAYQPPVAQPAYQPAPQPVAVAAPVAEPVMAAAPVAAPVAEPVVEVAPVEEPVAEPVVEVAPVEEPVAEPVVEAVPVEEPVAEPAVEVAPVEEPVVEAAPVEEPAVEAVPVEEPMVEEAPAQPVAAPARVFCTQCGQPLTTDQRFCPNCGTPNQ